MDFYRRFKITINSEEVKKRFINRAKNLIWYNDFFFWIENQREIKRGIATFKGEKYDDNKNIDDYLENDFSENLHAIETLYKFIDAEKKSQLDKIVQTLISLSEVELNIKWESGKFIRCGAELLDQKLVNNVLNWLRQKEYNTVLVPFEKGLNHFLKSQKNPDLLYDVITDLYESLEALSKIITKKDRELSANRELYIKSVKASDQYKKILKEYISYAQNFRHAATRNKPRPVISEREVESFLYLTGLFIRLAISSD